jgi:hypothetical protein
VERCLWAPGLFFILMFDIIFFRSGFKGEDIKLIAYHLFEDTLRDDHSWGSYYEPKSRFFPREYNSLQSASFLVGLLIETLSRNIDGFKMSSAVSSGAVVSENVANKILSFISDHSGGYPLIRTLSVQTRDNRTLIDDIFTHSAYVNALGIIFALYLSVVKGNIMKFIKAVLETIVKNATSVSPLVYALPFHRDSVTIIREITWNNLPSSVRYQLRSNSLLDEGRCVYF